MKKNKQALLLILSIFIAVNIIFLFSAVRDNVILASQSNNVDIGNVQVNSQPLKNKASDAINEASKSIKTEGTQALNIWQKIDKRIRNWWQIKILPKINNWYAYKKVQLRRDFKIKKEELVRELKDLFLGFFKFFKSK